MYDLNTHIYGSTSRGRIQHTTGITDIFIIARNFPADFLYTSSTHPFSVDSGIISNLVITAMSGTMMMIIYNEPSIRIVIEPS